MKSARARISTAAVFLCETPLPGEVNGGLHLHVVISTQGHLDRTGMVTVAPILRHHGAPGRVALDVGEFVPAQHARGLDTTRCVDVRRCVDVPVTRLHRLMGRLEEGAFTRVVMHLHKRRHDLVKGEVPILHRAGGTSYVIADPYRADLLGTFGPEGSLAAVMAFPCTVTEGEVLQVTERVDVVDPSHFEGECQWTGRLVDLHAVDAVWAAVLPPEVESSGR